MYRIDLTDISSVSPGMDTRITSQLFFSISVTETFSFLMTVNQSLDKFRRFLKISDEQFNFLKEITELFRKAALAAEGDTKDGK